MEKYNDYLHEIDCKKLINNKSENIMNENNSKKCNIKNLYLQNKLSRVIRARQVFDSRLLRL